MAAIHLAKMVRLTSNMATPHTAKTPTLATLGNKAPTATQLTAVTAKAALGAKLSKETTPMALMPKVSLTSAPKSATKQFATKQKTF
jgi:hypothetical protein